MRSAHCVIPGGAVSPLTLLCQPVTDWLHAPDHTGVVWGLYTCCWRSLNISSPNLQKAHFETAHMWPLDMSVLTINPPLKMCFTSFSLVLSQSAQESLLSVNSFPLCFSIFTGCWWIPPLHYECHSAALNSASFECSSFLIYTSP